MDNIPLKYLVSIQCFTYNQSKYICDALNGFVMQKTNFPFIILLVDDASTDGEQDVIRSYVNEHFEVGNHEVAYEKETDDAYVTYAQHKINRNCYIVVHYLKYNHYRKKSKLPYLAEWRDSVKYEALCEGDDYWIDPLKLQKQVNVMDKDELIGLCYTRARKFNQESNTFYPDLCGLEYKGLGDMLQVNPVVTLTSLYKVQLYDMYIKEIDPNSMNWRMGDYPFWLWIAANYKVHYLEDVTSVYRVLLNSSSHSERKDTNLLFILSSYEIQMYFAQKYMPEMYDTLSTRFNYYKSLLLAYRNEYSSAIRLFLKVRAKSAFDSIRFVKYLLC